MFELAQLPYVNSAAGAGRHDYLGIGRAAAEYGAILYVLECNVRLLVVRVADFNGLVRESPCYVALIVGRHEKFVLLHYDETLVRAYYLAYVRFELFYGVQARL